MKSELLYLGLDSSTQGLKATVIDADLNVVFEDAINYDKDLPEFGTEGGVHRDPDGLTVTSPAVMWVAAVDLLLGKMKDADCPWERIAAVSGSGQQHGSVWMKAEAREALQNLTPDRSLREQLADVFSVQDSPMWMDASTTRQCRELEEALGGAQAVADLTGSRAYERFTGNQIAKLHQNRPREYEDTGRIALVSSFVASLLCGDYAPIDTSDGSGMNLMDIRTKAWDRAAMDHTAPGLDPRLGDPVPGHQVVGRIHSYFVERYGFDGKCLVIAFSGDNPNSLAGLRLEHAGDVAISLGTSDTLFGSLLEPSPSGVEGHIFANPVDPAAYMAMIVRQNGSLTREDVRDRCAEGSWEVYNRLVEETPVGNDGNVGFYVLEPEITPPILNKGIWRFDASDRAVESFAPAAEARAVLEGQFLALRMHAGSVGIEPKRIIATGGASVNPAVIRVVCDVFGVSVFAAQRADSASLGAAYRALHGWTCDQRSAFVPFAEVLAGAPPLAKSADPDPDAHAIYKGMMDRYGRLEKQVSG